MLRLKCFIYRNLHLIPHVNLSLHVFFNLQTNIIQHILLLLTKFISDSDIMSDNIINEILKNVGGNVTRSSVERMVRISLERRIGNGSAPTGAPPNALLVNASARHCHLTPEAVETLFGPGATLTPMKDLYQPGAFAAKETVTLVGPRSRVISNLRILGPCRDLNQVELAFTDSIALGFDIPVRQSGNTPMTPGCMLMGPHGFFQMDDGVIRAAPHAHMAPDDAAYYGVKQGDYMKLRVGGDVGVTFDRIFVRVDPNFKLEVHIDTDEANACGLNANSSVELIK
jgi:putative phosphotransacetylase